MPELYANRNVTMLFQKTSGSLHQITLVESINRSDCQSLRKLTNQANSINCSVL